MFERRRERFYRRRRPAFFEGGLGVFFGIIETFAESVG